MKTFFSGLFLSLLLFQSCAQDQTNKETTPEQNKPRPKVNKSFTLNDYLSENKELNAQVESVYKQLNENQIIAQLIMPAVGK
ncbi:MAG: hypothetical protein ACKN86_13415, partial [Crocinitomicaceae bacterium]